MILKSKIKRILPYLAVIFGPVLLFSTVLALVRVSGSSMEPGMHDGDCLICLRHPQVEAGDVIVFRNVLDPENHVLVKRVAGVAGDEIRVADGKLYRNGSLVLEPHADMSNGCGPDFGPVVVPDGHVFVLGDNRGASLDSRMERVGFVDCSQIIGRVVFRLGEV